MKKATLQLKITLKTTVNLEMKMVSPQFKITMENHSESRYEDSMFDWEYSHIKNSRSNGMAKPSLCLMCWNQT